MRYRFEIVMLMTPAPKGEYTKRIRSLRVSVIDGEEEEEMM